MAIHFFDICLKAAVKGAFHGGTMHADGAPPGNKPKWGEWQKIGKREDG